MTDTISHPTRRSFLTLAATAAIGALAWRWMAGGDAAAIAAAPAPFKLTDAQWHERLSPQAYAVLREASTEYPFTSPLNDEHRKGRFICAGCALPLFASATKFDSGTGWPIFYDHLPPRHRHARGSIAGRRSDRGSLHPLRRADGSCVRRWSAPHWTALLHERRAMRFMQV